MTIKKQIKTIFTILIIFFSLTSKGQRGTITIKKVDTSKVTLSLAKLTSGIISTEQLTKDPILRLENNAKQKYSLKKCNISLFVNSTFYDYGQIDTTLGTDLIKTIRSSKKGFKLAVESITAIDKNGNEIKLETIMLKVIPLSK